MKNKRLDIRLTEEVHQIFSEKLNELKISKTEYITQLIQNDQIVKDPSKEVSKLVFQTNKIGNNLNQIAFNLNVANQKNNLDNTNYQELLSQLIYIELQLTNQISEVVKLKK